MVGILFFIFTCSFRLFEPGVLGVVAPAYTEIIGTEKEKEKERERERERERGEDIVLVTDNN